MQHFKSLTTWRHFIHHRRCRNHSFHNFTSISSSNTLINKHPTQQFEIRILDNNIDSYRFMTDILRDCISFGDLQTANAVHAQLIKSDPRGSMISLWNQILNLNCQGGRVGHARKLFESMPDRDTVSYNTFVSAYARRDRGVVECVQLFIRMQEECVKPNHITMSALIGASATLRDLYLVEVMHGLVIQCDWSTNEFVGSALVDAYAKRARLEDAVRAFEEISEADLVSWNVMINGCACNGSKELALSVFSRMRHEGLPLNSFTLASMTKICSEPSDLSRGMQLHGCVVKASDRNRQFCICIYSAAIGFSWNCNTILLFGPVTTRIICFVLIAWLEMHQTQLVSSLYYLSMRISFADTLSKTKHFRRR